MTRLSIITICFNNPADVQKSCASIDCQTYKPYEHLIIDGSTNQDIKAFLERVTQPTYRRAIHERDRGIADAFNKGIKHASGDLTLLLNSGDTLYDSTVLERVVEKFDHDSTLMWLHGKMNLLRGGIWVIVGKSFEQRKLYRGMRGVFHPTMFVRKEVYQRRGVFNPDLKMAMDYDFLCRIGGEKHAFLDYPIATFDPSGVSTTRYLDAMNEAYAVYRKYYGPSLMQTIWSIRLTVLHHLMNSPIGNGLYRVKVALGLANA